MYAAILAISTPGPKAARPAGAMPKCCPISRKSEGLAPSADIVIDAAAHSREGPLGVSVRDPIIPAAQAIRGGGGRRWHSQGDYNGRDREWRGRDVVDPDHDTKGTTVEHLSGVSRGEPEQRPNLTIITGAQATRVMLEGEGGRRSPQASNTAPPRRNRGVHAAKEVIVSAGAIGSPQLLLLSGIGPRQELEAAGIAWPGSTPHVGKHLQDHAMCPLFYPAPGLGCTMSELALAMGPDALRGPGGPLPADPADDVNLSTELQRAKAGSGAATV